jgi:acetyl-CoA carboxylase carboxyl transferase subunit beta
VSWITDVVPPKIKTFFKRETPENLWIKCPDSGQVVFQKDVESNQWVIRAQAITCACRPSSG